MKGNRSICTAAQKHHTDTKPYPLPPPDIWFGLNSHLYSGLRFVCIPRAGKPAEPSGSPEAEQSKSFLPSICPTSLLLFLHYKAAWVLLRVPSGGEGWAAEKCKREEKSTHQTRGVAVSRKLDVLQPTKFWKLKHPTDTELLNVTRKERQKKLHPATLWWSKHFFFFLNLKKTSTEAVYSQAARTQCVHYTVKKQTVSLGCPLWSHHSPQSFMAQCGSPLFTKMHSAAKSFKNTSYVALTGSGIKKKEERNVRPSIDTIQSCSSERQSTFRITLLWG